MIKIIGFLGLFYSTFFSSNIYANSECEKINLYENNDYLRDLAVGNQGNFSTCYAHSVSSLYNSHHQIDLEYKLDPYYVAMLHKKRIIHWSPLNLNYSLLSWAFVDILGHNLCSKSNVDNNLEKIFENIEYQTDQKIYLLQKFYRISLRKRKTFNVNDLVYLVSKELEKDKNKFYRPWYQFEIYKVINNLKNYKQYAFIFEFLKKEIYSNCDGEKIKGKIYSFGRGYSSNTSIFRKIKSVLKQNKMLSIGYCSDEMKFEAFEKILGQSSPLEVDKQSKRFLPRISKALSAKCGAHYTNVVGMDKINNKCHILVRNSRGDHFWPIKENAICLCKDKLNQNIFNCSKESFNQETDKVLACYYEAHSLLKSTYDVSYLK